MSHNKAYEKKISFQSLDKKRMRQFKWCQRNFPIGSLITCKEVISTSMFSKAYRSSFGIVVNYNWDISHEVMCLIILNCYKVKSVNLQKVNLQKIKTIQKPYSKIKSSF